MPMKDTFDPNQQNFLKQLLDMLGGQGMQGGGEALKYYMGLLSGSPESYEKFEAPIKRQFNEQIIPGIAERFTGAGAQSSSGFQQALGSAGAGLSEQLAAMRGNLQQQGAQGLMGALSGLGGLGMQQHLAYQPKTPSFLQQLLGGLGGGVGSGLGMMSGMGGFGGLMQLLSKFGGSKSASPLQ